LIASQLDWKNGQELLVANSPEIFANQCVKLYSQLDIWSKLRKNCLVSTDQKYSKKVFFDQIQQFLPEL
jgi:O-antigen biosynthesis protein